jgi:hypothetical protein
VITDVLLDHAALVPIAALLVVLACLGIGHATERSRHGRRLAGGLAAVSVLPALALTLAPSSKGMSGGGCTVQFALPSLTRVELLANLLLLLPPAFFATLACRRPLAVLGAAAGMSAAIETVQALAPAIGRACDTNDWFMNVLGIGLGVLLARATASRARRAARAPDAR